MTLPTKLTLLRFVLTFGVMGLLFLPGLAAKVAALVGFVLASLTDWLDGYLARRWNQISPLGVLLDPIADKVLILGMLFVFVQLRILPAWMVLIIAFREVLITGVRLFAAKRQVILSAAKEGKQKTVAQMITIIVILSALIIQEGRGARLSPHFQAFLSWVILGCVWVALLLTVASGVTFFWRHRRVLQEAMHH